MKLELTRNGVTALRQLAKDMKKAMQSITAETTKLKQIFDSLSEGLGVHANDFEQMIKNIKDAEKLAEEAINFLPVNMEKTAIMIEEYLRRKVVVK